jgi:hypothetical protein
MNPPGEQRLTKGRALAYQLALTYKLIKTLRPHRFCKRSIVLCDLVLIH